MSRCMIDYVCNIGSCVINHVWNNNLVSRWAAERPASWSPKKCCNNGPALLSKQKEDMRASNYDWCLVSWTEHDTGTEYHGCRNWRRLTSEELSPSKQLYHLISQFSHKRIYREKSLRNDFKHLSGRQVRNLEDFQTDKNAHKNIWRDIWWIPGLLDPGWSLTTHKSRKPLMTMNHV